MFDLLVLRLRNDGNFAGKQKGADDDENRKEKQTVGSVLSANPGGIQTKGKMSDAGNQLKIKKAVEFPIKMKPFHLTWVMGKCDHFDPSADDKEQQTVIYKVQVVHDEVIGTDLLPDHQRFVRRVISMSSKCNSENANQRVTNQYIQSHHCLLIVALQIKETLLDKVDNLRNMQIQKDKYEAEIQKFREYFKTVIIKDCKCGWCEGVLDHPEYWYYLLNEDEKWMPRCAYEDSKKIWYRAKDVKYAVPQNKTLKNIEDVVVTKEEIPLYGWAKGLACKTI